MEDFPNQWRILFECANINSLNFIKKLAYIYIFVYTNCIERKI